MSTHFDSKTRSGVHRASPKREVAPKQTNRHSNNTLYGVEDTKTALVKKLHPELWRVRHLVGDWYWKKIIYGLSVEK